MFDELSAGEIIAILSPLIAIQFGLAVFCIVKIVKEGTANLNKIAWCLIAAVANFIGPLAFLLYGKRKDR
jgi:hypothetical protein